MTEISQIIRDNIRRVKDEIARTASRKGRNIDDIQLMAVSKNHPYDVVQIALDEGITLFGENRVQEAMEKHPKGDERNYQLHMIGHLQTNKAKKTIEFFDMIQSVDSKHLAMEINKRACQKNIIYEVLIEINVGNEYSKTGFSPEDVDILPEIFDPLDHLCIKGVMSIPPFNSELSETRKFFIQTAKIYEKLRNEFSFAKNFNTLSMGMSHDYTVAIEEGANLLRIGTALFGARQ